MTAPAPAKYPGYGSETLVEGQEYQGIGHRAILELFKFFFFTDNITLDPDSSQGCRSRPFLTFAAPAPTPTPTHHSHSHSHCHSCHSQSRHRHRHSHSRQSS